VPDGWVITAGDDISQLIEFLQPSPNNPLVVRSSALEEDSLQTSAAGIYVSFLTITDSVSLQQAILKCFDSYHSAIAQDYRANHQIPDKGMAVIVQKQINGLFSGVAFSRNPVNQLQDCVCIESVIGQGLQLVSGEVTPEQYQVYFPDETVSGQGETPREIIKQIAQIAREIERVNHGIPQDLEWTYDGKQLWLLQTRPITNLQPLWTRKIAAEVIPGVIRPLTWSINQPLTCGVWGDIFRLVLGKKADELDFKQTATLHYHRAYFNATLLAEIFLLMGLPPESLDFLTRGSKFTKPPLGATFTNLAGLWRLWQRELNLVKDFAQDYHQDFALILAELKETNFDNLSLQQLLTQIDNILLSLEKATYYSILAPLSYGLRQAIFQVNPNNLDNQNTPEIASLNTLQKIAIDTRNLLSEDQLKVLELENSDTFFTHLAKSRAGETVANLLQSWLQEYGYLSEVATDISIPRWQEDPSSVRKMLTQFMVNPVRTNNLKTITKTSVKKQTWQEKNVQTRLNLKGKVTATYSQLLAYLRYSFLAIEKLLIEQQLLSKEGDIFFLKLTEIRNSIQETNPLLNLKELTQTRKLQWQKDSKIKQIPYLIYGNFPLIDLTADSLPISSDHSFQGIPASAGIVEGKIKVIRSLTEMNNIQIDRNTIIVVPYTDSGWSPLLAQAGGLIAEVGGQLSHGAIIAREYGIPAVMDIHHATDIFQDNQQVRIDGQKGTIEILSEN
jgi:pyruvate,water dikinase